MNTPTLWESEKDSSWLAQEMWKNAALCFEKSESFQQAAECWMEAGETQRSILLFREKLKDHQHAAPLLLEAGRYEEALASYRVCLEEALENDIFALVSSRLGIAACLSCLERNKKEFQKLFQEARTLIQEYQEQDPYQEARCWEALGKFGTVIHREDLVQLGYQKALECYGEQYPDKREETAFTLLHSAKENQLLYSQLKAQMIEWNVTWEGIPLEEEKPYISFFDLPVGEGAQYGKWRGWKIVGEGEYILFTYPEEKIAIAIKKDSNGWFHLLVENKEIVVNSFFPHFPGFEQQKFDVNYRVFFPKKNQYQLSLEEKTWGNWKSIFTEQEIRFSNFKVSNRTLVISSFHANITYINNDEVCSPVEIIKEKIANGELDEQEDSEDSNELDNLGFYLGKIWAPPSRIGIINNKNEKGENSEDWNFGLDDLDFDINSDDQE